MKLIDFLNNCKKLVDENPDALQMEMIAEHGASGSIEEISYPYIDNLSRWNGSGMEDIEDLLPNDYAFDSVIRVYTGN